MRAMIARLRSDRGGGTVELALVAPLLVGLLVGATEVAVAIDRGHEIEGAARAAAHYASTETNLSRDQIEIRAKNALGNNDVTVSIEPDVDAPCEARPGDPVVVTIRSPQTVDILFVSEFSLDLESSAEFLCTIDQ